MEEDGPVVIGDDHGDGPLDPCPGAGERLGRPRRAAALGVKRGQVGEHRVDRPADDELRQVHPVGADIGDRARFVPPSGSTRQL